MTNLTMGLGMRNGADPPSFTVLEVLIVNAYKRKGHGAELTSAHMARVFLLAAIMYVDDTNLLHQTKSESASDEELIKHTQVATTDWCMLGQATGGKLKAEKCGVYFMTYKFVSGKARLKKVKDLPEPLGWITRKDGTEALAHLLIP